MCDLSGNARVKSPQLWFSQAEVPPWHICSDRTETLGKSVICFLFFFPPSETAWPPRPSFAEDEDGRADGSIEQSETEERRKVGKTERRRKRRVNGGWKRWTLCLEKVPPPKISCQLYRRLIMKACWETSVSSYPAAAHWHHTSCCWASDDSTNKKKQNPGILGKCYNLNSVPRVGWEEMIALYSIFNAALMFINTFKG